MASLKVDEIEFTVICELNMIKDASSNSAVLKSEKYGRIRDFQLSLS